MATAALLGANALTWKHTFPILLFRRLPPLPTRPINFNNQELGLSSSSSKLDFNQLKLKCFFSDSKSGHVTQSPLIKDYPRRPVEVISNKILSNALKVLRMPAMAAVLLGLLLMCGPNSALAASGGRCGGSRSRSSSSRSRSSSSRSRSSSSSYRWRSSSGSKSTSSNLDSSEASAEDEDKFFCCFLILLVLIFLVPDILCSLSSRATLISSVLKIQVGLLGTARGLQKDLDRITETADTSTPEGLHYVLREAKTALLRNSDYWISSYLSVTPSQNIADAEKCFNKISVEERAIFDEETLVNVNNKKKKSPTIKKDNKFQNEYIVVTLLVATEGEHMLPTMNGSAELKAALQSLKCITSKNIIATEVLWTPQQENDVLLEQELLEDYPLLKRF